MVALVEKIQILPRTMVQVGADVNDGAHADDGAGLAGGRMTGLAPVATSRSFERPLLRDGSRPAYLDRLPVDRVAGIRSKFNSPVPSPRSRLFWGWTLARGWRDQSGA
jgi:hypothetical protein